MPPKADPARQARFEPNMRFLILIPVVLHIAWSLRVCAASYLSTTDTVPALEAATWFDPGNSSYWSRLATLDRANHEKHLATALARDPQNALLWIERGVESEVSGHPAAAEKALLHAADLDHQYVPRWTLAAFYFRQHDVGNFRSSARQALEMAFGDALPMLQMASQLGMSLDEIRRTMLPDNPPVYRAFLLECIRQDEPGEVFQAAAHVTDRRTLLYAVSFLFSRDHIPQSVELWNRTVPEAPVNLAGEVTTNPSFEREFLENGYDWRQNRLDGVVFWRLGNGHGLQLELDGRQPENCTLLTLPVPLDPNRRYRFQVDPLPDGFSWYLGNEPVPNSIAGKSAVLSLQYHRPLGQTRFTGTVTLNHVSIRSAS